jgi:hypothetical protein
MFVSPPFPDLGKLPYGSVLVVQAEGTFDPAALPDAARWEARTYGRGARLFWEPREIVTIQPSEGE